MGETGKNDLGIAYRVIIGVMIALSSVLPSFGDTLVEIVKIIKIVKPPDSSMSLSDISAIFGQIMQRYFILFTVSGLFGGMLFAPSLGHPDLRGWMKAVWVIILCQVLGFIAQMTADFFSRQGPFAIISGVLMGPPFAAEEQFRSLTSSIVLLLCFMLIQSIAIGLRKKWHCSLD